MTYFITIPNKYDYEPHPAGDFTSRDLVQIEADSPAEARGSLTGHRASARSRRRS